MKANCKKRACVRPEAKMKNKVEEDLNFDMHARRGRLVRRGPVREKASGPCPICVVSCVGRVASPRAQPVCSGGPLTWFAHRLGRTGRRCWTPSSWGGSCRWGTAARARCRWQRPPRLRPRRCCSLRLRSSPPARCTRWSSGSCCRCC